MRPTLKPAIVALLTRCWLKTAFYLLSIFQSDDPMIEIGINGLSLLMAFGYYIVATLENNLREPIHPINVLPLRPLAAEAAVPAEKKMPHDRFFKKAKVRKDRLTQHIHDRKQQHYPRLRKNR